jgi:hypothetical protein
VSTPPAWHPDPTGRHDHRWWDGERWTEHVADAGQASVDPIDGGSAATGDGGDGVETGAAAGTAATGSGDQGHTPGSGSDAEDHDAATGPGEAAYGAGTTGGGADHPTTDQPTEQRWTEPTDDQPTADQPTEQSWTRPTADQPTTEQSWQQPTADQPTTEQSWQQPQAGAGWQQPQPGGQQGWQQPAGDQTWQQPQPGQSWQQGQTWQQSGAPGYQPAPGVASPASAPSKLPLAAMITGLVSIPLLLACGAGLISGIVAIVLGFIGLSRIKRDGAGSKGQAWTGIVAGFLAIVIGIVAIVAFATPAFRYAQCVEDTGDDRLCEQLFEDELIRRFGG